MDEPTPDADADTDASVEAEGEANTGVDPDAADPDVAETDETAPDAAGADEADPETAEPDADWMEPVDRSILEYMESEDAFDPTQFDAAGICPANYAAHRCRKLSEYGLVNRPIPGVYEISDAGERYLAGELDPSDLEPDE